jgi:hypothetical protein
MFYWVFGLFSVYFSFLKKENGVRNKNNIYPCLSSSLPFATSELFNRYPLKRK